MKENIHIKWKKYLLDVLFKHKTSIIDYNGWVDFYNTFELEHCNMIICNALVKKYKINILSFNDYKIYIRKQKINILFK